MTDNLGDYRVTDPYINFTQDIPQVAWPEPTLMPIGEISFPDGTTMLVPQPVKWQMFRTSECTGAHVVARTTFQPPQHVSERRMPRAGGLGWYVVCVVAGVALMVLGLALAVTR